MASSSFHSFLPSTVTSLTVEIPPIVFAPGEFDSPKPKRCGHTECKKKLTMTDMDCRCGRRFCMAHRHAESHNCAFDYKSAGAKELHKILVKCAADAISDRI
jgi:hypothetical protein